MMRWVSKFAVFAASGAFYLLGQYFRGPWFENLPINSCRFATDAQGTFCNSAYLELGLALMAVGEILALIGLTLLFANGAGMRKWFHFSLWFMPLAALAVWYTPTAPCLIMCTSTPDYIGMVWNMGYLYIAATLALVMYTRIHPGKLSA